MLLLKSALALGSVAVVCLLSEIALRKFPVETERRIARPLFKTRLKPINSLRYREYEYPVHKGTNEFRIVVAGDSFSEGGLVGFDDIYPKRLERYLNCYGNSAGLTYQVINMSRAGRSTPQEVGVIKKMLDYCPDMVVLAYSLNDPEDWDAPQQLMALRRKHNYSYFAKPKGPWGFLYARSALARLVERRLFDARRERGYRRYFHSLYRDRYSGWQKAQKALTDLSSFCKSHNIQSVVLIFPLLSFDMRPCYPFFDVHAKLHEASMRRS